MIPIVITPPNPLADFGNALREARKALGLSQEDLALICGLDRTYISGLERGRRNPTLKVILLIATKLGMTASELLLNIKIPNE